jgi:hypothetical protein
LKYSTLPFVRAKGAFEQFQRAFAFDVFYQVFDGRFAVVEGDKIKKLKHPRFGKRAQFGVGKAAAHGGFYAGIVFLIHCAQRKALYKLPGNGTEMAHHTGLHFRPCDLQDFATSKVSI